MIAKGALDQYLTANASFTFWKMRYNKHTNFAMESVVQPFHTNVSFGSQAQMTINRNGDLIHHVYVVVDLPGIIACAADEGGSCSYIGDQQFPAAHDACQPTLMGDREIYSPFLDASAQADAEAGRVISEAQWAMAKQRYFSSKYGGAPPLGCCEPAEQQDCPSCCPDIADTVDADNPSGVWAHWANSIGQLLIERADVVIGGSTVDSVYGDFLFMWEELTGKSGKRLTEMVGKRYTRSQLICDSRQNRRLYIPLPFWFTLHSGNALPLAALQFHGVQLHAHFRRLSDCIVVSSPNVMVKSANGFGALTSNDLKASIMLTYVYLDAAERDRFATMHFEQLITQTQRYVHTAAGNGGATNMRLNFNHPVTELIWAVRRADNKNANNHFNFAGVGNRDPILGAELKLNNQVRFSYDRGEYFRLIQPYQHHSSIPESFIYCYSFAYHAEDASPSGSCNLSRIDNTDFSVTLQKDVSGSEIIVFARNFNVLRFREGLAGVAYTN